jgi:hypothetical protein
LDHYEEFIRGVEAAKTRNRRLGRGHDYHFYGQERDDAPNLQPNPAGLVRVRGAQCRVLLGLRKH